MRTYGVVVILLLAAWFMRLHNLSQLATQADEGVHITVAEQVAFNNRRIYGDLFENRTPGVEWLLAGWFRLVGPNIYTARALTVAVTVLTAAMLFALAQAAVQRLVAVEGSSRTVIAFAGPLAALLYILAPLGIFWSRFVMLEHFATAAATASIGAALFAWQRRSWPAWVFSGLLTALAVLFKQTEFVLLAVMILFLTVQLLIRRRPAIYVHAACWLAGFAITILLSLLVLFMQGTLAPFLDFVSGAGQLAPLANVDDKVGEIVAWSLRRPYPWLLLPAIVIASWQGNPSQRLLLLWFLAEAGLLLLPSDLDLERGGFSHYVLPALASASVLSSVGIVGLWQGLAARGRARVAVAFLMLLSIVLVAPHWLGDAVEAITRTDYPQATVAQEKAVGDAAALLAAPHRPIQVLGNAIFYHHARRAPATRFFHWPDYLARSDVAPAAVAAVTASLTATDTAAVVVSRLHLQERLPAQLRASLWAKWTPVALFPYPYQRDVLLFIPRIETSRNEVGEAMFDERIVLLEIEPLWLDAENLLVRLHWLAQAALETDYTVFVHLLDDDGTLLAQDDAIPVVGFRPTTTWQAGEAVLDYHWIRMPESAPPGDLYLSVGLYESSTGQRLLLDEGAGELDSYRHLLPAANRY